MKSGYNTAVFYYTDFQMSITAIKLIGKTAIRSTKKRQLFRKVGKQKNWIGLLVSSLGFWLFPNLITTIPAFSAEQVSISYGFLGFSASVNDLETFAKEGKITDDIAPYIESIDAKNIARLRQILQQRVEVNPTIVSQFTNAQVGKTLLDRMGKVFQTEAGENGATNLRTALVAAAGDSQGLTLLNLFRKFPDRTIKLNVTEGLQIAEKFTELKKNRDAIVKLIEQEAAKEAEKAEKVDFSQRPDLRQPGSFRWDKQTLTLNDRSRNRSLMVDVYLPQLPNQAAPLIAISHGAAGDRTTFAYLAEHLASYGFAVAVVEHPGDNSKIFEQFFTGVASSPQPIELINRPLEIKFLLDELERLAKSDPALKGRLNTRQVGLIGHSIGGYTALTLAGATINFDQLKKDCNDNQFVNLSMLVQCDATRLPVSNYTLQDERVKAIIAVNPFSSSILASSGLSKITIPTMLVASNDDIFTPALPEQFQPFTWLSTPNKYLVSIQKATHFSLTATKDAGGNLLPLPANFIGKNPEFVRPYLSALSTAFFQTNLANKSEYRVYLSENYTRSLSREPFKVNLIQLLTPTQFAGAIDNTKAK